MSRHVPDEYERDDTPPASRFSSRRGMKNIGMILGIIIVGFCGGIGAYLASHNTGPIVRSVSPAPVDNYLAIDSSGNVTAVEAPNEIKTVLRHPLIPGGLKNLNDFRAHVNRDPNLKHFYEANGFDFSCVTQQTLGQNEWVSVTYRSNKDIKWSNALLLLLKDETVFEDCHGHVIRAQCGNLVATVRKEEVDSLDLPPSTLVETPLESEIASNIPIPSIGTPPSLPIVPIIIDSGDEGGLDYGGSGDLYGGGGGMPTKTPEPQTGMLLGVGILALGLKKVLTNQKLGDKV